MKNIVLLFPILMLLSCNSQQEVKERKDTAQNVVSSLKTNQIADGDTLQRSKDVAKNEIALYRRAKLWITGDFDGDQQVDTVYEHNFSNHQLAEMDSVANPFENEWDTVVRWYYEQDTDVYLALNKAKQDTLHLEGGIGLYCLLNLGDINKDGNDEIALAVNAFDYSTLNSCRIYTLCNGKWKKIKQFSISERAFDYKSDKAPDLFTEIEGFLETKNKQWFYRDYMEYINAETAKDTVFHVLKLPACR